VCAVPCLPHALFPALLSVSFVMSIDGQEGTSEPLYAHATAVHAHLWHSCGALSLLRRRVLHLLLSPLPCSLQSALVAVVVPEQEALAAWAKGAGVQSSEGSSTPVDTLSLESLCVAPLHTLRGPLRPSCLRGEEASYLILLNLNLQGRRSLCAPRLSCFSFPPGPMGFIRGAHPTDEIRPCREILCIQAGAHFQEQRRPC